MIDYEEWANEYEQDAEAIAKKIDKLSQELNSELKATEKIELNRRLITLRRILKEKSSTAKLLRERGKCNES